MAYTTYFVVYASGGATPTGAQIVAGQDSTGAAALASGSQAFGALGVSTFATAVTTLTASTAYVIAFVDFDGTTYSNVVAGGFSTTAADGNGVVSGVAAIGAVSAPSASVFVTVALAGVAATGSAGSPAIASSPTVALTGIASSGSVAALGASVDSAAAPIGVSGVGAEGDLQTRSEPTVALAGVQALGEINTPTAYGEASTNGSTELVGVAATGEVATLATSSSPATQLSAVAATGGVGTVSASGEAIVALAGVSAAGVVSAPEASTQVIAAVTGVQTAGQVGTIIAAAATDANVTLDGVAATGTAGDLVAYSNAAVVNLTGVGASGEVGTLGTPTAVAEFVLDGGALSQIAAHMAQRHQAAQRIDASVSLKGIEAPAEAGAIHARAAEIIALIPSPVAIVTPVAAEPPPFVRLLPRVDAAVVLPSISAQIIRFRPREPAAAVPMHDPELFAAAHSAAIALLAAGWR